MLLPPRRLISLKLLENIVEIRARAIMMMTDDTHCMIDSNGDEAEKEKSLRQTSQFYGTHSNQTESEHGAIPQ